MLIVAKIHNNTLGKCVQVSSYAEGVDIIRGMAEEQLDRELNDEEVDDLMNSYALYVEQDGDNHYSWTIGEAE